MIWKKLLIRDDLSIKETLKKMDVGGEKILFVVGDDDVLKGAITDGNIRRHFLTHGTLDGSISKIYNPDPLCATRTSDKEEIKRVMMENKIEVLPIIDGNKRVIDAVLWVDLFKEEETVNRGAISLPVVIMAGGQGKRLDPFTKILPKPLIPVGDKAIIDIIMDKFAEFGINRFHITVNHKSKMIRSYFEETNDRYEIDYIEEDMPLGTVGSLRFLKDEDADTIMVSNCDIIVNCDYCEIVDFHRNNGYDMTIVGSFRHFTIPYGICEVEKEGLLKKINEKPEYDYLVNTGMTVIEKKNLDLIPENTTFHVPDLVNSIQKNGGKVGVFPINANSWIDVGHWEEYRKAIKLLSIE